MNPMNDTQTTPGSQTAIDAPATPVTDDTLLVLGRAAGNFRAAYWEAVDIATDLEFDPDATAEAKDAAGRETLRLLTSWHEAETAFEAYRAALNTRTHSRVAVVFVPVEEYAALVG